jgi:recombinational DNA repair protein (RecF pathway)
MTVHDLFSSFQLHLRTILHQKQELPLILANFYYFQILKGKGFGLDLHEASSESQNPTFQIKPYIANNFCLLSTCQILLRKETGHCIWKQVCSVIA